ncbi:FAD-dependent monooxygenase [Halobacillus fulvus]|nr:FAD-dependent monooxygenase [Halobacillus fulvus]
MESFDVIIVGARVAGSSLAVLLGKQGKKVLLIDKASFPSDTLSTHHMSHLDYLKRLDVLEEVEASGLRKIERMRTHVGESFVEGPRASYTIIPRRDHLDAILLHKARQYSDVREQCSVRELLWDDGEVCGVVTRDREGREQRIFADWVVGADGKNSNIARWVDAEIYHAEPPLRPVLYGYYEGVKPLERPATEIFLHEGRIGFLFPMEEGRDCLGIEIHPGEFKDMMASPREHFEAMYRQLYGMDERLRDASLQGKIIGTPGMPNHFRQSYGKGWILIGDAAHSKDPSTGLGINDAFMQSFLLAEAFEKMEAGAGGKSVLQEYQKKRDQQLLPGFQLTLDYIHSLKKWTQNEVALFQAMASNPMVWNKIAPSLSNHLKKEAEDIPLLYQSVIMEAEAFGYRKEGE